MCSLVESGIGGLEEIIKTCKRYANPKLLATLGQVVVAMVPSPEQLKVSHPVMLCCPDTTNNRILAEISR